MAHLYKNILQSYALKRNISFPTYTCVTQGPPHARLFKAHVTIDGNIYEGPTFCTTLKDAEHAAAKVAFLALSPDGAQEDNCLYKSLLEELAQKKGLLPVYSTNGTGPSHMPCFVSTVEIAGERYVGQEARTKKQAEMNAAKVAYTALNQATYSNNHITGKSSSGSLSLPPVIPPTSNMQITVNNEDSCTTANEADKGKVAFLALPPDGTQQDYCLYKSLLQELAQKKGLLLVYSTNRTGPSHMPCFASTVEIAGECYVGQEAQSKKKAEMNAAKVAYTTLNQATYSNNHITGKSSSGSLSLPPVIPPTGNMQITVNNEDSCSIANEADKEKVAFLALPPDGTQQDYCSYKSLLQELAQKKGFILPVYSTDRTGPPHMPCFVSTVEIAGECYVGQEARTKKKAEINAARVAYAALNQAKSKIEATYSNNQITSKSSSGSLTSNMQTTTNDEDSYSVANEADKGKGYLDLKNFQDVLDKHTITMPPAVIHQPQPKVAPNVADFAKLSIKQENVVIQAGEELGSNGKIIVSSVNESTSNPIVGPSDGRPHWTKIVIRPHISGMTYDGPIHVSDEDWVAMKVNVYEQA